MRLLRCHIENFGVLSGFDYEFAQGLSVICRENGFGKSTLAAFLKAMFYGLPRTGARNVTENERRRFEPWQGGKFGGFLEFEYQGAEYRVTRYFGKTAAKDTFSLRDLTNRTDETPFSSRLGEELFGLDAASFVRSTYLPQAAEPDTQATTSMRAKLSNLVDDTNDMNNFDTAEQALRQFRRNLRAYSGDKGKIFDCERELHALEAQTLEAKQQLPRLEAVLRELNQANEAAAQTTAEIADLREKIRMASDQKARSMQLMQRKALEAACEKQEALLQELSARYPAGLPSAEDLRRQRECLLDVQRADKQLGELTLCDADHAIVAREEGFFADREKTQQELETCTRQCTQLTELQAKLSSQLLPEETARLTELEEKFRDHAPQQEDLRASLQAADEMLACQRQLSGLRLSEDERKRLDRARAQFAGGVPTDEQLQSLRNDEQQRAVLQQALETGAMPQQAQTQLESLRRVFASGAPAEDEILHYQDDCRRIAELEGRKQVQALQKTKPEETARRSGVKMLLAALGAVLLVLGCVLLVNARTAAGIALTAAGALALLGAVLLREKPARADGCITTSAITDEENQTLYDLRRGLNDFLLRFYEEASAPEQKLTRLLLDRKTYLDLQAQKRETEQAQLETRQALGDADARLHAAFYLYFPDESYHDGVSQALFAARQEYETLLAQAQRMKEQREKLADSIEQTRGKLASILRPYCPEGLPEDLRAGMQALSQEASEWQTLQRRKEQLDRQNAAALARVQQLSQSIRQVLTRDQALDETRTLSDCTQALCRRFSQYTLASARAERYFAERKQAQTQKETAQAELDAFFAAFPAMEGSEGEKLDALERDAGAWTLAQQQLLSARQALTDFDRGHPAVEAMQEEAPLPDSEKLQQQEARAQLELDALEERRRALRQERQSISRETERLPVWEDRIAALSDERQSLQKSCALADRTMELLNLAKDRLANRYVADVERGFADYAKQLLGDGLGRAMLDKDLNLFIDEQGAAREAASFSAGTLDALTLCMRLALVDALFTKEQPFLLLDDPFVNLDDARTKRALELLQKISQQRQVVYLVCNSARV